ncbi:MAG TPA: hypothetical protein VFR18_17050 [Terriglobia bacterium]|nr:hypothetical protein [Terriglobia bacterium]
MLSRKRILLMAAVVVIGALAAFATQTHAWNKASQSAGKPAASKAYVAEGSLVVMTDDSLTIRMGKKDMSFKISSTTPKPTSIAPGSNVTVNYHNEGTQHIANNIQLAPTPSSTTAAKPHASK